MSTPTYEYSSTWTKWGARLMILLVILSFVPSAVMKLMHHPMALEGFTQMHVPVDAIMPIGIVELLCLVIYLIPRTSVLGAVLLTGYLGGATFANIIGGTDFIHALVIGVLVWGPVWLGIREVRALVPILRA